MKQTVDVKCPYCKTIQEEDIHDLTVDAGDMEGTFLHECDNCEKEFKVKFQYKPYVETSMLDT